MKHEWKKQDDLRELKKGDRVKAVGEGLVLTGVIGTVHTLTSGEVEGIGLWVDGLGNQFIELSVRGIKIWVPLTPLPTETGVYYGSIFGSDVPFHLDEEGKWHTWSTQVLNPARHLPMVKLEPVSETAGKVLHEISRLATMHEDKVLVNREAMMKITKKFGVEQG